MTESRAIPAVRSGRLIAAPTTENGSGCTRRGGYQPPEKATDSRRTPVERRRAACPHAAGTGLRYPQAGQFRRCGPGG